MIGLDSLLELPALGGDLERVERVLYRSCRSEDPFFTEITTHLLAAGGKRLRPALALAVGHLAEVPAAEPVVQGAAAVELVHLGSLYHDDVMDEAEVRRTVPSVNARWGNLKAILAGDFLLARASELAAALGTEVAGLLAATISRLCEGQLRELVTAFDPGRTEEAYFAAIEGKTASLMSTACRIGALCAGLPRPDVDALTEYGRQLGLVFQIVDDVLDVVASDDELGKPTGHDLVEGIYTLPVIRALASDGVGPALRALLGRPLGPAEAAEARDLVRADGAVGAACDVARRHADAAAAALDRLGDGHVVKALALLGHRLVDGLPR
jgi:heptaprenyl diphosphate synthase